MLGKQASGHLATHGVDFDKLSVETVVHQHPITEKSVERLLMPPAILADLQTAWAAFKGPVKNKTKFTFSRGLHESRHGFVVLQAKWERQKLDIGFMLIPLEGDDEEDFDETDEPITLWNSIAPRRPSEDERKWLEEVWTAIIPTEQIVKKEKAIQPNDPCSCGSGKKFKKCCGRFG
jgi:SEC-C motif-containing protein